MSDKTLSAQEFLQGKYPQMRGEKWNSNENINDNWIAEMMEEYASQQTSTLRKEIEDLTRAYNQCSESHRRSVDSHCIEKELLQKEIEAFEAGAKWQQQSSVDLEEVREKYNELIEDGENQEEEEFFPNIWNLFAPLIKGSEWISVEDRLPDDKKGKEKVIFYGEDYVMMGFFYEGKFRDCMYPHPIVINITHWQPLPQPPTQTKKG